MSEVVQIKTLLIIIIAVVYFIAKMFRKDARSTSLPEEEDLYARELEERRTRELLQKYPPPTARRRQPARDIPEPPPPPAASPRQTAPVCPICEHPVPGTGFSCPACGSRHHTECFTLFDGCGKCGYKIPQNLP